MSSYHGDQFIIDAKEEHRNNSQSEKDEYAACFERVLTSAFASSQKRHFLFFS